jgi:glycerol-3-phosphate dehydrogenase
MNLGTEVLVLGGGITGLGLAWDCASRGLKTVLLETGQLGQGASGQSLGLLHSGARYAVRDRAHARDCSLENPILRRILPSIFRGQAGLFALAPADPPEYVNPWLAACREAGIQVEEVPAADALKDEPHLNPGISRSFRAPDAACNPAELIRALETAMRAAGGEVFTQHSPESLIVRGDRVCGVVTEDLDTGERLVFRADLVLNCAGNRAGQVAALSGCRVHTAPVKFSLMAFDTPLASCVLQRCRLPGDGDTCVPVGAGAVLGAVESQLATAEQPDVESWEVEKLLAEGEVLVPRLRDQRASHTWAAVRPTVLAAPQAAAGESQPGLAKATGRAGEVASYISPAHAILDHEDTDSIGGLITVVGGQLTTFRLAAEQATDLICRKLNFVRPCVTAEGPAPSEGARRAGQPARARASSGLKLRNPFARRRAQPGA